jgi:hypothetical protein
VGIIAIPITRTMGEEAHANFQKIPVLNNSITGGAGTYAGCMGEIAVRDYLNRIEPAAQARIVGDYQYDILTADGSRLEVKTKRCTSIPTTDFECSVANFNQTQQCDFYVFTRVSINFVFLLGYMTKDEFSERSCQMRAGENGENVLESGSQFTFHADCRNVFIRDLTPFPEI